jgi:hypothetical protein
MLVHHILMLRMASLLIHDELVPAPVRDALRRALSAPESERRAGLMSAASLLHLETGIDCGDVKELVGLSEAYACG